MKQVITFCLIFIYATGGASQGIKPEERDISGKFNGTWLASSHIEKHSRIFSGLRFTCSERKFKITLSIINGWIVALDSKKAEGYIKEDGTFYVNRQIGEWETYFDQTNEQHLVFYGHLGKYRGDGKVVIAYGNSTKGCRGTARL